MSTIAAEHTSEHGHDQGRHADLLQGLGQGPGRYVLARLALECRHVGRTNALPRTERLPRGRARPTWPRPVQPGLIRQRHERLCRRSCGSDRSPRSQAGHAGGPLHRRRRGRALHRPPRNEPSRQGRPDRRSATAHAEDRRQSRGAAHRGVRRHACEPRQGPLAVLQGVRSPVLRRQPARRQGLARPARPVLDLEHAVPASRTPTRASRPSPRPTSPRTSRSSMYRLWCFTARTTRSFR